MPRAPTGPAALALLYVLLLPFVSFPAFARTWYILPDGSGDAPTIRAGIDSAAYGDTVLAAPGRHYIEERPVLVVKDGIVLTSETGPAATTLVKLSNAPLGEDIALKLVGVGRDTEISGFTIEGEFEGFPTGFYGVWCESSSPRLSNLILWDPYGWGDVAAVAVRCDGTGFPEIRHCTFTPNLCGIIARYGAMPIVQHNIIVAGIAQLVCIEATILTDCNDLWGDGLVIGCELGPRDFSEDPFFCNPGRGDFSLDCASPCLDGYGCGLIGALGVGCGASAAEPVTWSRLKLLSR